MHLQICSYLQWQQQESWKDKKKKKGALAVVAEITPLQYQKILTNIFLNPHTLNVQI